MMWDLAIEQAKEVKKPRNIEDLESLPRNTTGLHINWLDKDTIPHLARFTNLTYLYLKQAYGPPEDLLQLPPIPTLTHLAMPNSKQANENLMAHIASFPSLTHLDIAFMANCNDACINALTTHTKWQWLNLSGAQQTTDESFAKLAQSDALSHLELYNLKKLTAEAFSPFRGHPNLGLIGCNSCSMLNDEVLEVFATMPSLHTLTFHGNNALTSEGLTTLARATGLRKLSLSLDSANDEVLATLAPSLQQLRELDISFSKVTTKSATSIAQMKQLKLLDLNYCGWSDEGCEPLKDLKHLEELHLGNSRLTNEGFMTLLKCTSLRRLRLPNHEQLQEAFFAELPKQLPELEELTLDSTNVGSKHLKHLKGLTSLKYVKLDYCDKVRDPAVKMLTEHPSIETVILTGNDITDLSLERLSTMPKLQKVELTYCSDITDKGLAALAASNTLHTMHLQGSPITDETLITLSDALPLQQMWLYDCPKITGQGLQSLRKKHPNCTIDVDSYLWQTDGAEMLYHIDDEGGGFGYLDGELLVRGEGSARRWSLEEGRKRGSIPLKICIPAAFAMSSSGSHIAGGMRSVLLWDAKNSAKVRSYKGSSEASAVALSTNGETLAIARKHLEIIDTTADKKDTIKFDKKQKQLCALSFTPDGTQLWGANGEQILRWDSHSRQPLSPIDIEGHALHFSTSAPYVHIALRAGEIITLDYQKGVELQRKQYLGQSKDLLQLTGQGLFVEHLENSDSRTYKLWEVQRIAEMQDGSLLILANGMDNGWNEGFLLATSDVTYVIDAEPGDIEHLELLNEGQYLACAGHHSQPDYKQWVRIWSVSSIVEAFPS